MKEIITDIKALKQETLLNLQNSKANNTVRAYKSDFNDFGLFCAQNGFKSLPSEPKIVSLYLTYLSTKEVKMSTLKRRLVSIGVIHKLKGHYLDTKHPSIIENIMGIKRRKGSIQKGKKPLLINNLKQLINVIDKEKKDETTDNEYKKLIFDFLDYPTDNDYDNKIIDVINKIRKTFVTSSSDVIKSYFKNLYELNKSYIKNKTSEWFQNNILIIIDSKK